MSASRMPTLSPTSRSPRARLTAVVDLPTPPLPEATAMIASTPGTPIGEGALRGAGPLAARSGAGGCLRSAVSATIADSTPGTARTAASARAHAFPGLHGSRIDRDREEHLAVADHHLRELAARRERRAVWAGDPGEAVENLLFGGCHRSSI